MPMNAALKLAVQPLNVSGPEDSVPGTSLVPSIGGPVAALQADIALRLRTVHHTRWQVEGEIKNRMSGRELALSVAAGFVGLGVGVGGLMLVIL
jgi:hypothetical protein